MTGLMDSDGAIESYNPTLGLGIRVELNTKPKIFCGCSTELGAEPDIQTCPVCLGLPGALPVTNAKAVESAIRVGLALGYQTAPRGRSARKNYFYPDMTKNFQTSQHDRPIASDDWVELEVDGEDFVIEIERAHMEEGADKLTHIGATGHIHRVDHSVIGYNRAGMLLIETVARPALGTGIKALQVTYVYVIHLYDLMHALDISGMRMEQGSLRCDANVSLAPKGSAELGIRTEIKSVSSLRPTRRVVTFEVRRQAAILADGGRVTWGTRYFHEGDGSASIGRSKEEA